MPHMRTIVTFRSTTFNTSERRPYFINDGCFGDDVARWLITELQSHGVATDSEPDQEDFGWYFSFRPGDTEHQFIIGYRPGSGEEPGTWIGWVERRAGLIGSLLGARRRGIEPTALRAIHDVLASNRRVSSVRWHRKTDFDATNESASASEPDAA
jgi:hypothetical protein